MEEGGGTLMGHTLKFQLTVDVLDFKNCQNIRTLSYPYRIRML